MRDEHKGRALPHPSAAPGSMVHPHSILTGILNSNTAQIKGITLHPQLSDWKGFLAIRHSLMASSPSSHKLHVKHHREPRKEGEAQRSPERSLIAAHP